MMNTARALYEFWSGFGLPAYTVNTIPDEADPPYITYSLVEIESLEAGTHYAQIFYRATSNEALLRKTDEVLNVLGSKGCSIPCEGGSVVLRPANPKVQWMTDENPEIRYAYINMQINCYHD